MISSFAGIVISIALEEGSVMRGNELLVGGAGVVLWGCRAGGRFKIGYICWSGTVVGAVGSVSGAFIAGLGFEGFLVAGAVVFVQGVKQIRRGFFAVFEVTGSVWGL